MKLEISVFKETHAARISGKGFAGRELLVEGLKGTKYVSTISGVEGEVSAGSVPELIERIKEKVGKIDRKGTPELQFRFAPSEDGTAVPDQGGKEGTYRRKLEGAEISEFFSGMESIIGQAK